MNRPKFLFTTLILLCCFVRLSAQKLIDQADGYKMSLKLDQVDALYRQSESIHFTVTLTKDGVPAEGTIVKWTRSKDNYLPVESGNLLLENGEATLEGSLNEPGFLQCRFTFVTPQKSTLSQMLAAGVEPEKIKPSLPAPKDFDAYWVQQKNMQADIPLNIKLTPVESNTKGIETFDVQAKCLAGNFSAYIARPIGAKAKSLPAMVLCHGAGVASSRLSVAAKWALEGVIVIDFNVHGLPNAQPAEYYKNLYDGPMKEYYMEGRSSRDSLFFRSMLLRLLRAIDIVTTQPEWDGKNLIAFGRSQGGGQAIIAGGLDSRVNLICAEIPALCDHTGVVAGRVNGWPKLVTTDDTGKPDPEEIQAVRYVDAVNFAQRTKAKAYVTVGFIDLSCPPTSVYAMFNQLKGEKKILHHLNSGHRVTPEGEAFVREAVLDFLKKNRK